MTQEESNKLIAEFMGLDYSALTAGKGYYTTNNYQYSWGWLMPVVHKCLHICNDEMLNEWENGFCDALLSGQIATMYTEAVQFIQWYNLFMLNRTKMEHNTFPTSEIKALKARGWGNDAIYDRAAGHLNLYGVAFFGHKGTKIQNQKLKRTWKRILMAEKL